MSRVLLSSVLLALALAGCGKKKVKVAPAALSRPPVAAPVAAPGSSPPAATPFPERGLIERGVASWYGHPYHGRRAANGEIYDMETLVAAHRTLPFQTWVRVKNAANGLTVDVRIIDRGPFVNNRIIDLSHAAAQRIELIGPGVGEVELTIISAPANPEAALFAVQVGAFQVRANAESMERRMKAAYGSARQVERQGEQSIWRVLAGRETSEAAAEQLARRIREEQNVRGAFVVRLDP